uniref:Uncharacterized protein n=1 Tax=Cucumis sativus TaxID=3659 RepID=A0A0A0KQ53_CUCSA
MILVTCVALFPSVYTIVDLKGKPQELPPSVCAFTSEFLYRKGENDERSSSFIAYKKALQWFRTIPWEWVWTSMDMMCCFLVSLVPNFQWD